MSAEWERLLKTPGAKKAVCLELILDGGTKYFADTDLPESDKSWENRIKGMSSIERGIDPTNKRFYINDVTVQLSNAANDSDDPGYFNTLLNTETLDNREANIYLKFKDSDGIIYSEKIFSGICEPKGFSSDGNVFSLTIVNNFKAKLGVLQRAINGIAFPNVADGTVAAHPESTLGWGWNVLAGKAAGKAVRLIMIDDTANAEKFMVTQGGCYAVAAVYRKRANAFTALTLTTHYTVTKYALDAEGHAYSYITLTSGVWAEGDEYYADVTGIPQMGYATADGAADYVSRAFVNLSADFPGVVSKAFTGEFQARITTAGTAVAFGGVFGFAANQKSWVLTRTAGNKLRFQSSSNGSAVLLADCDTTLLSGTATDYTIRFCYNPDGATAAARIRIFVNGVEQSGAAWAATTALYTGGAPPFQLLTYDSGTALMPGRMKCWILADGFQPFVNGGSSDRDEPLENIISEWQFSGISQVAGAGSYYLNDKQGTNDLIATSLTNSDITLTSYESNPAWLADKLLRWNWFGWRLPCAAMSRASFGAAAAVCTARGYDTDAYFGWLASLGGPASGPEMPEDQWGLLAEFCRNFHYNPVISRDGLLELREIDVSSFTTDTIPIYRQKDGDIKEGIEKVLRKWGLVNNALLRYEFTHALGYISAAREYNTESQTQFGLTRTEEWVYRGIRHSAMMESVAELDMLLFSGQRSTLIINPIMLTGLQANSDIADYIDIQPVMRPFSDVQQGIVLFNSYNPFSLAGSIEIVPAQSHIGTCLFEEGEEGGGGGSEPEGATVLMSANTFVGKSDGGVHIDAHNATAYGTLTYLRHGHHYGNPTACYCVSSVGGYIGEFGSEAAARAYADANYWGVPMWTHIAKGYNNGDWRSLYRASFAAHAGKTIDTIQLRLFVIEKPSLEWKFNIAEELNLFEYHIGTNVLYLAGDYALPSGYQCRSGWSGGAVHRCTDTNWTTASTWFGEGWTDSKISTSLGTFGSGTGLIYVPLDKTYFQAACDGTADGGGGNEVNLVLEAHSSGDYSQNIKIASSRHATVNYRPALITSFSA